MRLEDEFRVVNHVKNLEEVNHHGQHAVYGQGLVETLDHIMYEREEAETVEWLGRKPCWGGEPCYVQ